MYDHLSRHQYSGSGTLKAGLAVGFFVAANSVVGPIASTGRSVHGGSKAPNRKGLQLAHAGSTDFRPTGREDYGLAA